MGNPLELPYVAKRLQQAGFATPIPHIKGYRFGERADSFASGAWEQRHGRAVADFGELNCFSLTNSQIRR